ncbi:MAG: hypothetical protein IPJ06_02475 [Saprospiraceae bacterium]|nr:hypothetical protein [Saprospiraceae bacterium]
MIWTVALPDDAGSGLAPQVTVVLGGQVILNVQGAAPQGVRHCAPATRARMTLPG